MKPEVKKCSKSCGCNTPQDLKKDDPKNLPQKDDSSEAKKSEFKLDPTHFGDWQINGRAIDF